MRLSFLNRRRGRKRPDEGLVRAGPSDRTSCDGANVYGMQIGGASANMRQSPDKTGCRKESEVYEVLAIQGIWYCGKTYSSLM